MNDESIDDKRKRLTFRSWHRGTRELDLIMGSFADRYVPEMGADELVLYDEILSYPDPDLYNWITAQEIPPANFMNTVLERLLRHQLA